MISLLLILTSYPTIEISLPTHRSLRQSMEEEQSKSATNSEQYTKQLAEYAQKEAELDKLSADKDDTIATLTKERDASAKEMEVLMIEIGVLESKINDVVGLETANEQLKLELEGVQASLEKDKSLMESEIKQLNEQVVALEEDLANTQKMASTTEKALEETRANLSSLKEQYENERKVAESLQEELTATQAKLSELEPSVTKTDSEREAASAKQMDTLRSQIDSLTAELKETSERASKGEEKIKLYEDRVQSMTGQLMESGMNVEAREGELAQLRMELSAAKDQLQDVTAKASKKNEQLQSQLDQTKKEMIDSLAKADMEIRKREDALQIKEVASSELQAKLEQLQTDVASARAAEQQTAKAKIEEKQSMEAMVQRLQSDLSKEVKLREEVRRVLALQLRFTFVMSTNILTHSLLPKPGAQGQRGVGRTIAKEGGVYAARDQCCSWRGRKAGQIKERRAQETRVRDCNFESRYGKGE